MSEQYPGGFITKSPPTPSGPYQTSSAQGLWTMSQAAAYQKQGLWPIPGNVELFPVGASLTFSSANTFSQNGPSQSTLTSYYNGLGGYWPALISYYTQTRGVGYQQFTIPTTGTYQFEVYGAVGGCPTSDSTWTAGQAARITVTVALTAGDVLQIIVGQGPGSGQTYNGGGGGGTFVLKNGIFTSLSNADIICIAGGSAGGAYANAPANACANASLTSTANTPQGGQSSGTGGGGGNGAGQSGNTGAAAPASGLYSNGTNFTYYSGAVASNYIVQNGGAVGGLGYYSSVPSGFGGAGGSGNHAGGAGGGYNGGGGGSSNSNSSAGGSSYFSAPGVTFVSSALWGTTNTTSGQNGQVIMTRTA